MFKRLFSRPASNLIPPPSKSEIQRGSQDFLYGNVWVRIWENTSRNGTPYFRLSINRLARSSGRARLRNSYSPSDIADIQTALVRASHWIDSRTI